MRYSLPAVRRVVLDTMYVRSANPDQLDTLHARGFALSLSAGTLNEVWVSAHRDGHAGRLFGALQRLLPRLDRHQPIAPEPDTLQAMTSAMTRAEREAVASRAQVLRRLAARLQAAVASRVSDAEFERIAEVLGRVAGQLSTQWVDALQGGGVRSLPGLDHLTEREATRAMVTAWKSLLRNRALADRCDAFFCVSALNMLRAARGQLKRPPQENDADDLGHLTHLGIPAFFATQDGHLLRDLRESGTYQAPWVMPLEHLLDDTRRLPRGMPWGDSARAEHAIFKLEHEFGAGSPKEGGRRAGHRLKE